MEQLFDYCIRILRRAFDTIVSEEQYHQIVDCLRFMATLPPDPEIKKKILSKYGWPETYDPLDFDPCRIRFCLSFTRDDDIGFARQEYDVLKSATC